jgi:hypothetical protein
VTDQGRRLGPRPPRSRQVWAIVRVGIVTTFSALALFLFTSSMIRTIVIIGVGVLGISVLVRALSAGRRRAAERAMADDLAVLSTVVGTRVIDDGDLPAPGLEPGITPREQARRTFHRKRLVIVCLFADRIVIRALHGRASSEPGTIYNREVSAAEWQVVTPGARAVPQLQLTMTGGVEITVVFDITGQRRQLAQFRSTLTRVLPLPVTGQAFPPEQKEFSKAVIAAIAAGVVIGAGVIPWTAMMARGSG